ncbi:hypothetical protein M501DRAFT_941170 [Patellaria atrata CBS 101060]|uniref:Nucleoporin Pom152 n=1 Tax=Patellaria atrata CBS 101060 TaxID=1346257 RepID=A0A9P4S4C8_9PEZI|nr:hypothetical protein M501DRAFT_941170 [Patellaria atrata CBS 101060]
MDSTPKLRSAFPSTPRSPPNGTPKNGTKIRSPLPEAQLKTEILEEPPLIPFDVLDAPNQRFYVFAFWVLLMSWRLYDYWNLQIDESESLWLFLKWVAMDTVFLYGVPLFRIPWLEWSTAVFMALIAGHSLLNYFLMFRVPIPFSVIFIGLTKFFYDREIAISERSVKASDIYNNASLLLGRQIIHILPEGSALLNPNKESFCLDSTTTQIHIPIQINQTIPISIELLRIDLETMQNETITISSSAAKKLRKAAQSSLKSKEQDGPLILRYAVKKTGLYKLQKVLDESKLEVQRRKSQVVVVQCPQARIKQTSANRCRGDLSDVSIEVEGAPPLNIKYRKTVNGVEHKSTYQSIAPEEYLSTNPLESTEGGQLVLINEAEVAWARSHQVTVPLNEIISSSGRWIYSIDKVQDALGNTISYANRYDEGDNLKTRDTQIQQSFTVHERPKISFRGCDAQRPLQVAKGYPAGLPVFYDSTGKGAINLPHNIDYRFTPEAGLLPSGEHSPDAQQKKFEAKNIRDRPTVREAGLYTLESVSTEYCSGEVLEPTSCLLQNPPEPDLSISTSEIFDKCSSNPVGLTVDLDLIGTPPFDIEYFVSQRGAKQQKIEHFRVPGLRGQLELTPANAGHYTYKFNSISDAVYRGLSLLGPGLTIEQDVKPSASAHFLDSGYKRQSCIDEPVSFNIKLQGEGPWSLEYELVHGGKRSKHKVSDIETEYYTITTDKLKNGGEYTLSLASVTDRMGCKEFLKEEARINVRHQKPKASFGLLEGKRAVRTLEGKREVEIPLRLTGEGPWKLSYRTTDGSQERTITVKGSNDWLSIKKAGTYELTGVSDAICPGTIDTTANTFDISWIPRPGMNAVENPLIERTGNRFIKREVCEGDEDIAEITLSGTPPYDIKYEQHYKPVKGNKAMSVKQLHTPLNQASIRLETKQSGIYEYIFRELADSNYDHDAKHHTPVIFEQRVNPRPDAQFKNPGKTFSYCFGDEDSDQVIPITLTGIAPFHLEVEIKHHGSGRPEILNIPSIASTSHNLHLPHTSLNNGNSALIIRKVRDARGCSRTFDAPATQPRVQLAVHDAPTIVPLESSTDLCVGDHVGFALTGVPPFTVHYTFQNKDRKATSPGTTFRRLAEQPGVFSITSVSDAASHCAYATLLKKHIHALPSAQISKGRETRVDIHEGGEAELLFEMTGAPPFEVTYTRSEIVKGRKPKVLETKTIRSERFSERVHVGSEGVYEVVVVRDRWCGVSRSGPEGRGKGGGKLVTY